VCLLLLAGADVTIRNNDGHDWIERYRALAERPTASNRDTERVVVRFLNEVCSLFISQFELFWNLFWFWFLVWVLVD
jgi:hypothetical protein